MKIRIFKYRGIYYAEFSGGIRKSLRSRNKVEALETLEELKKLIQKQIDEKLTPGKPTKLSVFATQYEKHRVGISKWTVKKDMLTLKLLIEAVDDILISTLDSQEIDKFKRTCLNRGTLPITINGYLRHLKAALHFACDRGLISVVPKIKMLPTGKLDLIKRVIAPADIQKLLNMAMVERPDFGRYLSVIAWTGCRRSEIMGLRWEHVLFELNAIDVTGKGKRERRIPMMPAVQAILEPIKKEEGPVFEPHHPDTLSKWFHALTLKCHVRARLHDLRHSAVTYMLKNGMKVEVVMKIVGHTNISTTMVYTHVADDVMAREMEKFRLE